ncbi:hypothetical protein [Scytonema sp. UIC 10036]|uniref:hypothetical protein n=1 Tax=Scytonema sp. UIC 10036 TaxID=2304196 RepID=UPI001FAA6B48|nr:hypothetical protein [Scytonema sp. UIC 10036]
MARKKVPSFITEIPLIVDSTQEKELLSKFEASRQLYNACLNEAIVRMELVRNSELFKTAKKIPRANKKERTDAFSAARQAYRYSDYDLQAYAKSKNRAVVNEILRHGNVIKAEKVSVKAWQKRYGKAIAAKSLLFCTI